MTDRFDDLEDRIRTHADRHPDATAAGVVGAFDALDPSDLEAVRALVASDDGLNQQDGGGHTEPLVKDAEPITKPNGNDAVEDTENLSVEKSRDTNTADDGGAGDSDAGGRESDSEIMPYI